MKKSIPLAHIGLVLAASLFAAVHPEGGEAIVIELKK